MIAAGIIPAGRNGDEGAAMDVEPIPPAGNTGGNTDGSAGAEAAGAATEDFSETIARALLAHPSVVRLDGGRFGEVISPLPGRRVVGVRAGVEGAGVEVAVVLALGEPIPVVVDRLRALVHGVAGRVPVDIDVVDVVTEPLGGP
jgi:hypothetical protein